MSKVFVCKEGTDELVGMLSKTDILNVGVEGQEISQMMIESAEPHLLSR